MLAHDIVLAEDDDELRPLVASSLRRRGFTVCCVDDGESLVAHVRRRAERGEAPDLIVTDVNMPGIDGIEAVGILRDWLPHLPVVVVTAYGDAAIRRRVNALDHAHILDKPFHMRHLHEKVDALLPRMGLALAT